MTCFCIQCAHSLKAKTQSFLWMYLNFNVKTGFVFLWVWYSQSPLNRRLNICDWQPIQIHERVVFSYCTTTRAPLQFSWYLNSGFTSNNSLCQCRHLLYNQIVLNLTATLLTQNSLSNHKKKKTKPKLQYQIWIRQKKQLLHIQKHCIHIWTVLLLHKFLRDQN